MSDNDLKPCAHCGGEAIQETSGDYLYIICDDCYISTPESLCLQSVVETWNTRANDWISVETRLPEDIFSSSLLVCYTNDCAENAVTTCDVYLSHLGFCIMHENKWKPIVGVTHWRPLPEPPGGENE